jgi:UTP--glucose-1-phosphate uridylyltransferase
VIRTAIIPVAGLGTRMRPVSTVVPKAMLPLVDARGRARTVAHVIVAEAAAAGVETAVLVVSPAHAEMIERYFADLDAAAREELPDIQYAVQETPGGFGRAVLCGADFVGAEPFLLLLGDHIHIAEPGEPACAAQVVRAFDGAAAAAVVGMQPVGAEELSRVGVARGEPVDGRLYRCTDFVEKPDEPTAGQRLITPGLAEGTYLAHCGIYAFAPRMMMVLAELDEQCPADQEVGLADAQKILWEGRPDEYLLYRIAGRAWDTGTPEGYAATQAALRGECGPADSPR